MRLEIWSDVVCPWCYIGKKRFETAVEHLRSEGTQLDLEISFRPFQLDPNAPSDGAQPVAEAYAKKFGGPDQARKIIDHVTRTAADSGIEFRMDLALRANTLRAHRMMHLALVHHGNDAQTAMKQYLLESYFTRGEDITSDDVLIAAAGAAGISPETAREWLVSNEGDQEVRADISRAGELGITAVPTFVFDDTWAIPGAQDVEVFERVLRRLAEKSLSKP